MTDEIPEVIRKEKAKRDGRRKAVLLRQMQKLVDHEAVAQKVGRKLAVRIRRSLPFGTVAQAVIRWNAVDVSWSAMQKLYERGRPIRAEDPVYRWCLAWHEVAHFNVPVEKHMTKDGFFAGYRPHGPKFRKYCSERGHHWNCHADVELWREKFNEKLLF